MRMTRMQIYNTPSLLVGYIAIHIFGVGREFWSFHGVVQGFNRCGINLRLFQKH